MAISKAMRAALHALSYPANIDVGKTYKVERAMRGLRTPLAPLYHLWDHKIERDGHDVRVRIYTPKKTDGQPSAAVFPRRRLGARERGHL